MNLETTAMAARTPGQRRQLWLFLLLAMVVLGAGIGLRDPWPADEPRFALVAKTMVESGEWLITHRGSELYSDKPPMFMALQAAAYSLIGNWRIAFLLPSLLAALGTLWLVYDFGRRQWSHRVGLWAALAVLATVQFTYQSKRAQIDPLVTFFITLANYGLLRHFLLGPNWRMYWLGCFAAGLGVISKGVGVLALLMVLPYLFARWRNWQSLPRFSGSAWAWLGGVFAFAGAIALWIVPMVLTVQANGSAEYRAYLEDILFRQTAARYSESWDHPQPPWYFLEVMAFGWLPLSIAIVGVLGQWRERLRARDARYLLPLGWVLLVLVFFSIPSGKRDMYILPALPWVALMCAPHLDSLIEKRGFRGVLLLLTLLLAVLFLGGGLAAWNGGIARADAFVLERGLADGGKALWGFMITVGAVAAAAALVFGLRRSHIGLGVALAGLWLLWSFQAYPLLNESASASGIMHRAGVIARPEGEIGMVAWKEQNLLQADRKVTEFGFLKPRPQQLAEAIRWQEAAPERRWIFIRGSALQGCVDRAQATLVGHANRREWLMFRSTAVLPECRGGRVPEAAADADARIDPNDED